MSAIGTKRTSPSAPHVSAFGGKAGMTSYSTFAKSRHRAPHGSFILWAIFFGHSAVSSPSQSMSFRITATLLNEAVQPITTIAPALIASDQWTNSAQKKAPAPHKAN
jgi:hypothetical protein